jgi:hypothetical protein
MFSELRDKFKEGLGRWFSPYNYIKPSVTITEIDISVREIKENNITEIVLPTTRGPSHPIKNYCIFKPKWWEVWKWREYKRKKF